MDSKLLIKPLKIVFLIKNIIFLTIFKSSIICSISFLAAPLDRSENSDLHSISGKRIEKEVWKAFCLAFSTCSEFNVDVIIGNSAKKN